MIPYILHVSILMAGCYIFYWLFLRQETFFKLNRGVLIACLLIPMILPLITIPASLALQINPSTEISHNTFTSIEKNNDETIPVLKERVEVIENESSEQPVLEPSPTIAPSPTIIKSTTTLKQLMTNLYFTGVIVFALAFLIQLIMILAKIASLNSFQDGKYKIVELVKDEAPYSFWNTIFINPAKYDSDTYEQILAHEKIHIDQTHFVDMLLVELALIAFWFNPFVWLFRKAITNNLEFLTDDSMLVQGFPKQSYQMSLLKVSVPQYPLNLTTNYNQSFLKNRIAMMNTKKSSARSVWKYLFILPLLGFSVMSLNAVKSIPNNTITESDNTPETIATAEIIPESETSLEDIYLAAVETNDAQEKDINEELPISEENRELKEEVMSNLKKDNLLNGNDPVFKIFPNKIMLNEKSLTAVSYKKYKAIFKKYDITANKSRLLIVKPLVIMSGTFVGNKNADEGSHVDIFDEEENQDFEEDKVNLHTTTTTTTNDSGNRVSVTTINGKTYIRGTGEHNINGKTYNIWGDEVRVIEEDGRTYILEDEDAVEKALEKAHQKSHKKHIHKSKNKSRNQSKVKINPDSDDKVNRQTIVNSNNGHTTESYTITTKNGRTYIQGSGSHVINGRTYTNKEDKVLVIDSAGNSYHVDESSLDDEITFNNSSNINNNISTNQLSRRDKHYLKRSNEGMDYNFVSTETVLRSSTNQLWQVPKLCNGFYNNLLYENFISEGTPMVFYLGQNGAYVNGQHLPKSMANEFVTIAKNHGYSISDGFHLQFDGQNLLLIDQIVALDDFRKKLLKQLDKDGFISNKKKKMVMRIDGNTMSVNGNEIPNNKFTTYFKLFDKHRVIPAPGKTIETSTKRGKTNILIGYTKDNSTLGTFATY